MKVLSLRQPWANAVLYLGKSIENRTWYTRHRGEFLIHAAKAMKEPEYESARDFCENVLGMPRCFEIEAAFGRGDAPTHKLLRGGIVGRARIIDVVGPRDINDRVCDFYKPHLLKTDTWRWHMRAQFGFVLADVRPTPFIPCVGQRQFFDAPAEVIAALARMEAA